MSLLAVVKLYKYSKKCVKENDDVLKMSLKC